MEEPAQDVAKRSRRGAGAGGQLSDGDRSRALVETHSDLVAVVGGGGLIGGRRRAQNLVQSFQESIRRGTGFDGSFDFLLGQRCCRIGNGFSWSTSGRHESYPVARSCGSSAVIWIWRTHFWRLYYLPPSAADVLLRNEHLYRRKLESRLPEVGFRPFRKQFPHYPQPFPVRFSDQRSLFLQFRVDPRAVLRLPPRPGVCASLQLLRERLIELPKRLVLPFTNGVEKGLAVGLQRSLVRKKNKPRLQRPDFPK
mmetsp:Transcript_28210/g.71607  ORF Transcript_28210/g.71607 Transcript_28210/m.71607 type:complete len:253 (-) Transcript_28210:331-1089(-)